MNHFNLLPARSWLIIQQTPGYWKKFHAWRAREDARKKRLRWAMSTLNMNLHVIDAVDYHEGARV